MKNVRQTDIVIGIAKEEEEEVHAELIGNLTVTTLVGHQITFKEILYVPMLRRNLISMMRLLVHSYQIVAKNTTVEIL